MTRWRVTAAAAVALVMLFGVWAFSGAVPTPASASAWQEIAWPFPRDAWPAGLAFECPTSCGRPLRVFVRPKRGFCANCDAGVVADAEVDAVADLDLVANDFTPNRPGATISIGDLVGRQRAYTLHPPHGADLPALGLAMTRRRQCDLVVAMAEGVVNEQDHDTVIALLASDRIASRISDLLDGR